MKSILKAFSNICPLIVWDRYTDTLHEVTAFGWIERTDGEKDFIVLNFQMNANIHQVWFCTSSAKYSEQFGRLVNHNSDHLKCKKIPKN